MLRKGLLGRLGRGFLSLVVLVIGDEEAGWGTIHARDDLVKFICGMIATRSMASKNLSVAMAKYWPLRILLTFMGSETPKVMRMVA